MPGKKRPRRERTHDWQQVQQYALWPEQHVYELLRPVVLFHEDRDALWSRVRAQKNSTDRPSEYLIRKRNLSDQISC